MLLMAATLADFTTSGQDATTTLFRLIYHCVHDHFCGFDTFQFHYERHPRLDCDARVDRRGIWPFSQCMYRVKFSLPSNPYLDPDSPCSQQLIAHLVSGRTEDICFLNSSHFLTGRTFCTSKVRLVIVTPLQFCFTTFFSHHSSTNSIFLFHTIASAVDPPPS